MMRVNNRRLDVRIREVALAICIIAGVPITVAAAGPASPHHGFLGGPWEVLAKLGHEGDALRLPLSIADENKEQEIDKHLPVRGTPIKVQLKRYVPDLKPEAVAVEDPNGGAVARLSLRGERLEQDLWLSAREVERQAIISHIGSVAIRELPGGDASAKVLKKLVDPDVVGTLRVWLSGSDTPLVFAVTPGKVTELPGSPWKLSVLRYVPHYSVDRETREVTNLSEQPTNPAIELRVEGDGKEFRQWVWSKFPSSPHKRLQLPVRVQFVDFHVSAEAGHYVLAVTPGLKPHLLSRKDGNKHLEPVEPGKRYPFKDERYSFAVEQVLFGATIETRWANNSEMLLHPAILATISEKGDASQEVALELNKPHHQKTRYGTLVWLYRRVPQK